MTNTTASPPASDAAPADVDWTVGPAWLQVHNAFPGLHPQQQRVARVLLAQNAGEIAELTATDVAALAGVSLATVVRTCQSAGFKGFRHLVVLLARDARPAPARRVDEEDASPAAIGRRYLRSAAAALDQYADVLDGPTFDAAAAAIATARRLLIAAYGWSLGTGHNAMIRFCAIGRPAEAPADAYAQLIAARGLDAGDVCLTISYTTSSVQLRETTAAARAAGATVIAITSSARSVGGVEPDLRLVYGPAEMTSGVPAARAGVVNQAATLEALYLAVAARLGEQARRALHDSLRAVTDTDAARGASLPGSRG